MCHPCHCLVLLIGLLSQATILLYPELKGINETVFFLSALFSLKISHHKTSQSIIDAYNALLKSVIYFTFMVGLMKNYANYWFPLGRCSKWLGPEAVCWGMTWCSLWGLRGWCTCVTELSQLGKRVAQWYAPFHQSPFLFLIKSISLSLSQS